MSLLALTEVWSHSTATGTTLLVMLALADQASSEGVCFPYEESIAAKARTTDRTVRRAITDLRTAGELDIWEWRDKRTRTRRNCYRVTVGTLAALRGIEPADILERATILRERIPTATRRRIFQRDGWQCVDCGDRDNLTIDHVVPVSEGGGGEDENLATRCATCNQDKADRTVEPLNEPTADRTDRPVTRADAGVRSRADAGVRSHAHDPPLVEPSGGTDPPVAPPPAVVLATVDRKPVTMTEHRLAEAVLAEWNSQTGQKLTAKEWLAKFVMRIREHPELGIDEHAHIIAANLERPWWKGHATPSVIYGDGAQFERSMLEAQHGVSKDRPMTPDEAARFVP